VGGVTEVRQLLLAALLLADELSDLRAARANGNGAAAPDPALTDALERLAARVESVADQLEKPAPNA
jgi:cell division protein ZapA